jgi:two-component system cell cycle response regulator DivK
MKILLVEDNEMNRDMLSRRLIRRGFEVPMATDGQLAVEMAASEAPDLILMDISLPILDGYAATRAIRATSQVPIIALTANANESDRALALAAGCNDYDTKPVDVTRLLEKINALLPSAL